MIIPLKTRIARERGYRDRMFQWPPTLTSAVPGAFRGSLVPKLIVPMLVAMIVRLCPGALAAQGPDSDNGKSFAAFTPTGFFHVALYHGQYWLAAPDASLDLTKYQDAASIESKKPHVITVKLRGKINHAQLSDYHAVVPGVNVWIAEYPFSKQLNVRSDEKGWWTMDITKYKGIDIGVSLVYEKQGWVTTKSNVITVTDEDNLDIAIQYIDPDFFYGKIKPFVEIMISAMAPKGADKKFRNAIVATVGKKWASIHDDRLPHGDPGATVNAIPGAVGPIYFDESVTPNPAYSRTSVDGGVAWLNVAPGDYVVTAFKQGVTYHEVKFVIDKTDFDNGIVLYIASPPDSIQGSNESAPGEN